MGGRRAHRPRDLALLLEDARRRSTSAIAASACYGNWLYFLTPDNYFVSLDAATGKERWHHEIANMKREYFSTSAPIIIGKQVIIGVGGDALDVPGYLESRDPESGDVVWRWNTTPRPGEPGAETWPDDDAMSQRRRHAVAARHLRSGAEPLLHRHRQSATRCWPGKSRAGDNLWTCSIVALNPDTGKLVWYYQVSPHDTHDWDAAQTPVLIDGVIDGKPRKLLAQANRNGHFFVLDRTNGKHILTTTHIDSVNWTKGMNANGQPIPNPGKGRDRFRARSCRRTRTAPRTGRRRASAPTPACSTSAPRRSFSVFYLTDTDERPQGWAAAERNVGNLGRALKAIDYKTGKVKWSRPLAMRRRRHGGGADGPAQHGRQAAVRQRRRRQLRRLRSGDRQAAVARRSRRRTRATVRKPICSTAASTSSSAPATRCTRSRCRGDDIRGGSVEADERGDMITRRDFGKLALASLACVADWLPPASTRAIAGVRVGVQTYSFRELPRSPGTMRWTRSSRP